MSSEKESLRIICLSFAVNVVFSVVKIATGILGNSYALVADGIESVADVLGSLVVWNGLRIAATPPDANHPYGHGKAESLAGFLAALGLAGSAVFIAVNSIIEIAHPKGIPQWYTLAVLIGVVVFKGLIWFFMRRRSEALGSSALRGDAWHHFSDAATSLAVMLGVMVALIGGERYASADSIAALLVCGFILYNAWRIGRPCVDEIMDASADPFIETAMRREALSVAGVMGVHHTRMRKSGLGYIVDIEVEVAPTMTVAEGHAIAHAVKDHLLEHATLKIHDVTVHIEPHRPR